jgi:hypothetical protein
MAPSVLPNSFVDRVDAHHAEILLQGSLAPHRPVSEPESEVGERREKEEGGGERGRDRWVTEESMCEGEERSTEFGLEVMVVEREGWWRRWPRTSG